MMEEQFKGKTYYHPQKSKPVETTPSKFNESDPLNYLQKDNIKAYPMEDEGKKTAVEFVEGGVYTIGRDTYTTSADAGIEQILV